MMTSKIINEEGGSLPTNLVGSGNIAGTGGLGGEPGVSKRTRPIIASLRRFLPSKIREVTNDRC